MHVFHMLLLILFANAAPLVAAWLLGPRLACPLDGGRRFFDAQPWLGRSKTWRGLLAGTLAPAALAPALGIEWPLGMMVGAAAMAGDLLSSFIKRRLHMASSAEALGLDQIPEALLPAAAVADEMGFTAWDITTVVASFFILEIALPRLLHRLRLRKRPK